MALRNASASARSRSAWRRRRESLTSKTKTETSANDMAVTKAGKILGNKSGTARRPSIRSISVVPGKSSSCLAVNKRLARGKLP